MPKKIHPKARRVKSKEVEKSSKTEKSGKHLIFFAVIVGVVFVAALATAVFLLSQRPGTEDLMQVHVTTIPEIVVPDVPELEVLPEEMDYSKVVSALDSGYTVAVTDDDITLRRGESERIGAGFENRVSELKYFNANVILAQANLAEGGKTQADVADWVDERTFTYHMKKGDRSLFEFEIKAPVDAEPGSYLFHVNVCYFDEQQKAAESGCDSKYNKGWARPRGYM